MGRGSLGGKVSDYYKVKGKGTNRRRKNTREFVNKRKAAQKAAREGANPATG